ncbi:hypothetical protein KAR91_32900 [Candidatus Pacearchaeota archaeon]|nr:hypothetical protein [Candidatus Pacearchaeota archaeon]
MKKNLKWKVNTPQLLTEIIGSNEGMAILHKPLTIFQHLLAEVANRAIEINDEQLNKIMIRLSLYEHSTPDGTKEHEELMKYLDES